MHSKSIAGVLLGALEIIAGSRIDLDYVALLDEDRNENLGACFDFCWLGDIRRRIALRARLAFDHLQLDLIR